jgi:hypothetical protein
MSERINCMDCEALLHYLREHGWDKCALRVLKGEGDPTVEEMEVFEDVAARYINHYQEAHLK